ncbi:MAG: hypothetical protein JOZ87_29745 [Chloroflexi bacterium]|nr:hypothetical protein [Chloroflexota bacterium]
MKSHWQLEMHKVDTRWRIRQWTIVRSGPYEGDPTAYQLAAARIRQTA